MVKNEESKKKHAYILTVSIVLTFVLLVFSIFIFTLKTLGWFAKNTDVSSNGMNISIETGDFLLMNLQCHPVTNITENEGVTTYHFTDFVANETKEIPLYDPASLINNKYKLALVLKFNCIIKAGKSIDLSAQYSADWYGNSPTITIENEDNIPEGAYLNSNTKIYHNFLSNCVQIRPVSLTATNVVTTANNEESKTFFSDLSSFTGTGTPTKITDNNKTIPIISNYTSENDENLEIYLVLEYTEKLIDYFCNSSAYYRCEYKNDITFKFTDSVS